MGVLTPEGVPPPGVELSFEPGGKISRKTEQAGQFTIIGKAGDYQVTASFPGFEPTRQAVKLDELPGRAREDSLITQIILKPAKT